MPSLPNLVPQPLIRSLGFLLLTATVSAAALASPWKVRADTAVQIEVRQLSWRLQGPFAEQRVELALRNPSGRAVEATVLLPLADGERLRGYALDVAGEMRDAVPVERVQARVAFETMTARQVDPALVERDSDSDYRLRVFPIPAGGERRLRIDLSRLAERSSCGWRHRLSADALPAGSSLNATLVADSPLTVKWAGAEAIQADAERGWSAPLKLRGGDEPRSVCLAAPAGPAGYTHRLDDGTQLHWLEVPVAAGSDLTLPAPKRLEIVWDASLRMPSDRMASLQLLDQYFRGRSLDVTLTTLRLSPKRQNFQIRQGDWSALREVLLAIRPEGALDLGSWSPAQGAEQVLMFSELRASWPRREALKAPGLPVHLISAQVADMATAQLLMQDGGQWLNLATGNAESLAAALLRTPGTRIASGWDQQQWQAESRVPSQGVLRACHVRGRGLAGGESPILRLTRTSAAGATQDNVRFSAWKPEALVAFWCGSWWVQALEVEPLRNKTQLAVLGQQLGLVNRETSLLVLETAQDYANHGVVPPVTSPALRDAVFRLRAQREQGRASEVAKQQEALQRGWAERQDWWATDFVLKERQAAAEAARKAAAEREREALLARQAEERRQLEERLSRRDGGDRKAANERRDTGAKQASAEPKPLPFSAPPMPSMPETPAPVRERVAAPAPAPAPAPARVPAPMLSSVPAPEYAPARVAASPSAVNPVDSAPAGAEITLRTVRVDEPYVADLEGAQSLTALDAVYSDLRQRYEESPAFHVDVAERYLALGDAARSVQVLSNVVAMMPRESEALRLVAYRLQAMGQHAQALDLLQQLRWLAPDEPQSWRDLGLALGQAGQCEAAAQALRHVLDTAWPTRFADIDLVTLGELNALQIQCPSKTFDELPDALKRVMPIGLRVVLGWNLRDTDIDLHVLDPNGETANFARRETRQGGRLSRDFTAGYGPEEFLLRKPIPGTYKVMAKYYGGQLARLVRGATVQVVLQTGFGTAKPQSRTVTLRLAERGGLIEVGQFVVDAQGKLQDPPKPKPASGKTAAK